MRVYARVCVYACVCVCVCVCLGHGLCVLVWDQGYGTSAITHLASGTPGKLVSGQCLLPEVESFPWLFLLPQTCMLSPDSVCSFTPATVKMVDTVGGVEIGWVNDIRSSLCLLFLIHIYIYIVDELLTYSFDLVD